MSSAQLWYLQGQALAARPPEVGKLDAPRAVGKVCDSVGQHRRAAK